jgi:mycoredoxin
LKKIARQCMLVFLGLVLAAAASAESKDPVRSYGAIDVILYQTSWCPHCGTARKYLQDLGVSLIQYDIEEDEGKRAEMVAKSGARGVPVIDVEGIIIRGYSPSAIKNAVERRRREY